MDVALEKKGPINIDIFYIDMKKRWNNQYFNDPSYFIQLT